MTTARSSPPRASSTSTSKRRRICGPGLGARHAAAGSISSAANAIAVVVSETSVVRVFSRGQPRAEIVPEFFHRGADTFFAIGRAEVHELPEVGLTVAFAHDGR